MVTKATNPSPHARLRAFARENQHLILEGPRVRRAPQGPRDMGARPLSGGQGAAHGPSLAAVMRVAQVTVGAHGRGNELSKLMGSSDAESVQRNGTALPDTRTISRRRDLVWTHLVETGGHKSL